MSNSPVVKKIAITLGDRRGVGPELVEKALRELNLPENDIIMADNGIVSASEGEFCYKSLEAACALARAGKIGAIVTGPVSKKALHDAGYSFNGQTEVLEHLLGGGTKKAEMLFIARDLRLLLLTRHIPLKDVAPALSQSVVIEKTLRLVAFLKEKCGIEAPKIAICALNPHAGEDGILGNEEKTVINPAIEQLNALGIQAHGAFAADGLFSRIGDKYLKGEKQEYDAVISPYHDQGLCAVKALAFNEVVNTTIGLPIIRTSPSCGTAYDIAGKGIANHKSMTEAVKLAYSFCNISQQSSI
jgi:4-hydroxythreonine-4-phosphate dehydrogenase